MWVSERGRFWTHFTRANYPITLPHYPITLHHYPTVFELLLSHSEVFVLDELYELWQIEEGEAEHEYFMLPVYEAELLHELKSRAMLAEYYYPKYYSTGIDVKVPQCVQDYRNIR